MNARKSVALSLSSVLVVASLSVTPSIAAPIARGPIAGAPDPLVQQVQWRRHHHHHHGHYHRGGRGGAVAAGVLGGLALGAAIGAASAYPAPPPPAYYPAPPAPVYGGGGGDWYAYCASKYRSFDPASGTYLGYDGYRHPCQ